MLFDSNILIRYLNNEPVIVKQLRTWRSEGKAFVISSITVAEVLSLKTLSTNDIVHVQKFLTTFISKAL